MVASDESSWLNHHAQLIDAHSHRIFQCWHWLIQMGEKSWKWNEKRTNSTIATIEWMTIIREDHHYFECIILSPPFKHSLTALSLSFSPSTLKPDMSRSPFLGFLVHPVTTLIVNCDISCSFGRFWLIDRLIDDHSSYSGIKFSFSRTRFYRGWDKWSHRHSEIWLIALGILKSKTDYSKQIKENVLNCCLPLEATAVHWRGRMWGDNAIEDISVNCFPRLPSGIGE
jgi:hypothetical protein